MHLFISSGILDLTKESLFGCKEFTEDDIQKLSQGFANDIKWKCEPAPKHFQDYFDDNCNECNEFDNNEDLRKFDIYVKFM